MSKRKNTIIILFVLVLLLVGAIVSIQIYREKSSKENKAAQNFIDFLYQNDMVDKSENKTDTKYKSKKISDGSKEYYQVSTENFTVNLDSNYNVIGFNNYKLVSLDTVISENSAREIAEKYISNLSNEDYKFKELIKEGETKVNYYSYIFTRYKEGYPFYSDQIVINIDKTTGYLSGYSNTILQGSPKAIIINTEQVNAENSAIDLFNQLNKDGKIKRNTTYKAFCDTKDKATTELCYVVTVEGVDSEEKEVRWKYFISTETGEVINSVKDNISITAS